MRLGFFAMMFKFGDDLNLSISPNERTEIFIEKMFSKSAQTPCCSFEQQVLFRSVLN